MSGDGGATLAHTGLLALLSPSCCCFVTLSLAIMIWTQVEAFYVHFFEVLLSKHVMFFTIGDMAYIAARWHVYLI